MNKFKFALMLATASGIALPAMAAPLTVPPLAAHASATTASQNSMVQHVVVKKKATTTKKRTKKAPVHKPAAS